jgi:hypothetical protein
MPSVSKSMGKAARAGAKALRDDRARMAAVKREVPARRPAPRPVPHGVTIANGARGGSAGPWTAVVLLVLLNLVLFGIACLVA